jgi:hypothetical protein
LSTDAEQSSYGYFRLLYFLFPQKADNVFANRTTISQGHCSMTLHSLQLNSKIHRQFNPEIYFTLSSMTQYTRKICHLTCFYYNFIFMSVGSLKAGLDATFNLTQGEVRDTVTKPHISCTGDFFSL